MFKWPRIQPREAPRGPDGGKRAAEPVAPRSTRSGTWPASAGDRACTCDTEPTQ